MLNLAQFSPHVQTAIKTLDLQGDAAQRVKAGVQWLDRNAPFDWRLQMISIYDGKVSSNVRICRDTENPLALAFRRLKFLQRTDGRVTWATVLESGIIDRSEAKKCGFVEKTGHAPNNVYIDAHVDGILLDNAWAEALGNYKGGLGFKPYPEEIEQGYVMLSTARRLGQRSAA